VLPLEETMNCDSSRDFELFEEAVQLSPSERFIFLDRACAGDPALRQRIEALLKSNDRAGCFMETPPTASMSGGRAKVTVGEKPGDRIGRYKLCQEIGEGGCGVVFMAEQEEPLRRRVALKLIKPGMDSKSVIARFEAERQALAMMDHPSIAHVFDAGAAESGRPYFVMELVEGIKITEYCDRHSLPTSARLELFAQVCDAIQHAHQKGIIHRDIKPSNVLVTTAPDGKPASKVIDFGIAKATTDLRLTDKTILTSSEMLIGTPAYMSPEQAALTNVAVDTRTDIYSLGVLLYELLTGATPFNTRELLRGGLDEVRRVILHQEPVRPSTRLSTMVASDLTTVARLRQMEAPRLIRAVRGDLDWIAIKALEKDRARRYQTTSGLADDVRRFLGNEAIAARPPTAWYRLSKAVERNKTVFTAVGVIALILVAGLGILARMLTSERVARREANLARANALADQKKAELETVKSEQVKRFLEDMLRGVGPSARGRDTTVLREILDKATERIGKDLTNQPAVQAELWTTIGGIWNQLGVGAKAEPLLRSALEKQRILKGNESPEIASLLLALAAALPQAAQAEPLDRESVAIRRKLFGNENPETTFALNALAYHIGQQGKWEEAENLHREVLALRRKLFGNESLDVAQSLGNLAIALRHRGNLAECEAVNREALAIRRKLEGETASNVAGAWANLGLVLQGRGNYSEAEHALREALKILRLNFQEWHPTVIMVTMNLVNVLAQQKKADQVGGLLPLLRKTDFNRFPEGLQELISRASSLAQREMWQEARADAALAVKFRPDDHSAYHVLAPVLVMEKDFDAYQKLCHQIVTQFGDTSDLYVADRMAKDCLILPVPGLDFTAIGRLANLAVSQGEKHPALSLFQVCKALAEYRLGNFAGAVEWAQKPLESPYPHAVAEAGAILAMGRQRLGQTNEARSALAAAVNVAHVRGPQFGRHDLSLDWRDWVIAHTLQAEAKQMIEP
jgi:eukaryotic-like serine/threonine-protein kinase